MSIKSMSIKSRVEAIDALLPQTQCRECGFNGCLPYAEALAAGTAPIDRCPPGGMTVVRALAALLNKEVPATVKTRAPSYANIRESECIGCTKCIQACPVDAIVGAAKFMHSVMPTECTGCGLCVAPCPVDCIELIPLDEPHYDKVRAKQQFMDRKVRLLRDEQMVQAQYKAKRLLASPDAHEDKERKAKQAYIAEALERVKKKHNG